MRGHFRYTLALSVLAASVLVALPAAHSAADRIKKGTTKVPGTTEEVLLTRFDKGSLRVGEDYFLAYSPEREDPGSERFSTQTIPKVVGGTSAECLLVARTLYGQIIDQIEGSRWFDR